MERFRTCVRTAAILFFSFVTCHLSLVTVYAQEDELAPPPIRTVTKDERAKLNEQADVKIRTKLAIEMMNTHLASAEQLDARADLDGMFRELGGFHGLLDNTLEYLTRHNNDSNKMLDNFKRLEIGLRGFATRLETIRRELPTKYEDYVRTLLKYVREARSRAVDPFFDDNVIRMKKPDNQ